MKDYQVYTHKKFGMCTIEENINILHPALTDDYVFVRLYAPPQNVAEVVLVDRGSLRKITIT